MNLFHSFDLSKKTVISPCGHVFQHGFKQELRQMDHSSWTHQAKNTSLRPVDGARLDTGSPHLQWSGPGTSRPEAQSLDLDTNM